MTAFMLPDLGEGLHEAEIVAWHVTEGDHVVTDQPLVSVETDKAVVEIPAPYPARVSKLVAQSGDRVTVGQPIIEFEAVAAVDDAGTVVGDLGARPTTTVAETPRPRSRGRATPAVRALAKKLGVNVSLIQGSGPDGVVTTRDVERADDVLTSAAPAEPMRGIRRAMAERMGKAHLEVPRATVTDEADVDAWSEGVPVMLRLIRGVVSGCRAVPALNAWFDREQLTRRLHQKVDLGVAVETDDGLLVPVLRDVGSRTRDDLQRGLDRLKKDAHARTLRQEDLRGQTITLSNFGTVGGLFAELVVVPPQVAIVGVGRMAPRTVVVDKRPVGHETLPLSVTFDHRAVTGAEAARFLRAVVADLEQPE